MNEENVVYICKMHNQWEFAIRCWELNLALCYNLEMWNGVGGRREALEGRGHMYAYGC